MEKMNKIDYKTAQKVLEVKNLRVNFTSDSGMVYAVRGVSFDLYKGETLCIVGESGSGKSVTSKTIMGILAANAIISSGQILYEGEDLVRVSEEEFHRIRGHKIGMIFQDPLSSLNPIVRVGKQITEATLINRNILKRHYNDLIAKELIAARNLAANRNYILNLNKSEKAKILGYLKDLNNKKVEISEDKLEFIAEWAYLFSKAREDEIVEVKKLIDQLKSLTSFNPDYLEEEINTNRIALLEEKVAQNEEFLKANKLIDSHNYNDLLNHALAYLKESTAFAKHEYKVLNPLYKKALATKKASAKVVNKAYAEELRLEKDDTVAKLNAKLLYKKDALKAILEKSTDEEKALYEHILNEVHPKKPNLWERFKKNFKKEKQVEINISHLEKQEEKITSTGNKDLDKAMNEVFAVENEIERVTVDYINKTKITKAEAKKMALNVMKEVGIPLPEKRFKQYPFEFSGGMRQRIVIAIALTANPDILICDEPTTALDVTIQAQILELINKLKAERGLSCIFITHDLGVVANMADRVAVMYAGKIVEYGTSYEIFFNPKHPYTWALLSSIPDLDSKERLEAIPGTPPDMRFPPKGDAFALRSKYALAIDFKHEPPFFKVSDTHYAATWLLHEDAPAVEMPRIVKTRIANSIKSYKDDELNNNEELADIPNESIEMADEALSVNAKSALLKDSIAGYRSYEDGKIVVSKDDDEDEAEHPQNNNELERVSKENLQEEIHRIRRKAAYKPEYVENNIILSVNHLKQYFFFGRGLNKYKLKAVHDVSFQIKQGECFGVVGESGCGKTTTGRSIIRLYHITSGSIYYKGYRIGAGSRWNEKEIKYTRIRFNKLKKDLNEKVKSGAISQEEAQKQIFEAKSKADDIIRVQKEKIKQIKYDDKHVDKLLLNEIQMIFQDPIDSLDPRMTVEDIIKEGLTISRGVQKKRYKKIRDEKIKLLKDKYGEGFENNAKYIDESKAIENEYLANVEKISMKHDHERVVDALEKVGLIADYANRYPHEFSGGQRQRIGIARALIMNPQLLICDEPISALDVSIRAQIINLLNGLKEEMGLTIMFIAHDLSVVKYFCDRIAVMYFGEVVELADSDTLFKHPLHPYTKSLLSAIPRPNPLSEKGRKRIVYNPREVHDYTVSKPKFVEIEPGHFILANDPEIEKYKEEMAKIDAGE